MAQNLERPDGHLVHDRSVALHEAACGVLPGGVSSNFRLNGTPVPLTFSGGAGACLFDVDGNTYIDYAMGMGATILGHAPAVVTEAVARSLKGGQLFAGQHEGESMLAERLRGRFPSMQRIRFGQTGSEVVQAALRLARAHTGRRRIIKFEGHYHGWFDSTLVSVAPPVSDPGPEGDLQAYPGSEGQVLPDPRDITVLRWNEATVAQRYLHEHASEIAAVITEPVLCNTCVIAPEPGYLEALAASCERIGALLIFDEVITGLRLGPGGAQERLGIRPHLTVMAKALGAGFAMAALGGRADIMSLLVSGGVLHGGTFNGNTVSTSAAIATLDALSSLGSDGYAAMEARGERLMAGLSAAGERHGLPLHLQGFGSVFNTCFLRGGPVRDYPGYQRADLAMQRRFLFELQERGVRPTARGTWMLSFAHTDGDVAATLDAADRALGAMARA